MIPGVVVPAVDSGLAEAFPAPEGRWFVPVAATLPEDKLRTDCLVWHVSP